jgi:preprotein translocase subunit SecD
MLLISQFLTVLYLIACLLPQYATDASPHIRFEFRLAQFQPAPGLIESSLESGGVSQKIYLHKEVLISNEDILDSRVVNGPSESIFEVEFSLTREGAERMSQATQEHKGRQIAVIVDGRVTAAPTVIDRITSDKVRVSGNYTREEAERIAKGIRRRQ